MRESERLRGTPRSVCVVCSVSVVLCVSFFTDVALRARSYRTGLCQHAFPEEETSVRLRSMTGPTLSQPLCAQDPGPEPHTLTRQQVVSAPALQTSWAKASCCTPYRPMPAAALNSLAGCILPGGAAPNTLAGCILHSTRNRDSHSRKRQIAFPIKDSGESFIQPLWMEKNHVSSAHVRDRGGKVPHLGRVIPVTSSPAKAPTNQGAIRLFWVTLSK